MILLDTSVWVDHLRSDEPTVVRLLGDGQVACHPWVTGELSLGSLAQRQEILTLLANLPQATVATDDEVAAMIEGRELHGRGIGYVDVQLLAATLLSGAHQLWTRDKRLAEAARDLGCAAELQHDV